PDIVAFMERVSLEPDQLNQAILEMTEQRIPGEAMAERFLKDHSLVWANWLDAAQAARLESALGAQGTVAREDIFLQWSGAEFVNRHLANAVKAWGESFRKGGDFLLTRVLLPVETLLLAVPAWLLLALV